MNTFKRTLLLICTVACLMTYGQSHKETIKKELRFKTNSSENLLVVDNIFGSIEVEGYSGATIQIEAEKSIDAYNNRSLEQGKQEVGLRVVEVGNTIYAFLNTPYTQFFEETGRYNHNERNSRRNYNYSLNFKIKVPHATNIELKTVNNGDIKVSDVYAKEIIVKNINGAITLDNITGKTYANALNQDINISYKTKPLDGSSFKSLNGNINIDIKEALDADITFKSMNGGFYTNLSTSSAKPLSSVAKHKRNNGVKYKVNSNQRFRLGDGGAKLSFDLLNGDATIKI